jgi:hypothetical protein
MTAAADVTSAPPPPQRAAKHRNQHRGKHGKQQRGVRIFTNAVPHGQPNLPRKSSSGETDDDVAQRPDETLDARASEFHPVKPPLNLASYRDAALTVDDEVAPAGDRDPDRPAVARRGRILPRILRRPHLESVRDGQRDRHRRK